MEKGAYFPDCRLLASSFPASAVATLATGAWPAQHGIVADTWFDPATRKLATANDDVMLASTLASQIAADNRNRVYVVASQESHANIFAGGADARLYWMDDNGLFATSADTADWMTNYNNLRAPENFRNNKWTAINSPQGPALRTLTWTPERPAEFMTLYKSSPSGQETLFDFAGKLIQNEKMGQQSSTDFLCILSGSSELLGYEQGARSPLMLQLALHLDLRISILLAQLMKVPGENGFSVAVVGGHGAPPEPTGQEYRERAAVKGDTIADAVNRSLTATALGRVDKYIYPFLYLDASGFRDPEPIRLVAARAAMDHPAVEGYYTAGGACSTRNEWERRFRNSFHPARSGDLMLSYHSEYVEDYGYGRGVSYGSLYNYDIRVPLFLYGPQFRPGVYDDPVESVDVAPTLARVAGVGVPSSSVGHVLGEALLE